MSESLERYYRILGLDEGASRGEIKNAYRRLALRYHPDKNPDNRERATKIFIAINKAYSILIDKVHIGEIFETVDDAKNYFKRNFYDLARRISNLDRASEEIQQDECDYFFKYQLEEVHCVRRSVIEGRRIIELIRKAVLKGYDISRIQEEHGDFFEKHGFDGAPQYDIFEELISEYKSIIQEDPGNSEAHYELGVLYEKHGIIDIALSEYRITSYIDPDNVNAKRAIERLRRRPRSWYK
jgi:curved DNA-binding protein CbpA